MEMCGDRDWRNYKRGQPSVPHSDTPHFAQDDHARHAGWTMHTKTGRGKDEGGPPW
jgi:hypothetical protein